MVVFVVYDVQGAYSRQIASRLELRGSRTAFLSWRKFDYGVINKFDPATDVIFFRTGAEPTICIARAFEDAGFLVLNDSRYIAATANKYLANAYAACNGIRTPELNLRVKKNDFELMAMFLRRYGSLVAKPIWSCDKGRYVFRLKTESDFDQVYEIPGSAILLQNEIQFDRLVRTIVTRRGMLVDATTYDTKHESWKATVCENPDARHYKNVPGELIRTAEKVVGVFGGQIAYIDFFETSSGFVLNEVNHSCGLVEHERISGYPIAQHLGDFILGVESEFLGSFRRLRRKTGSISCDLDPK